MTRTRNDCWTHCPIARTSQALRDAANGKAASATVNVELAKGDAERVERITQDMENDNGQGRDQIPRRAWRVARHARRSRGCGASHSAHSGYRRILRDEKCLYGGFRRKRLCRGQLGGA